MFTIAILPPLMAYIWYKLIHKEHFKIKWIHLPWGYLLGLSFVYGYMNLIIHQIGFYELFFTDIQLGKEGAQETVDEFLNQYGRKHRHFLHGVFHGAINAVVFGVPILSLLTIVTEQTKKWFWKHWLLVLFMSLVCGGLISEFI
ncbi:MAG: hypothetical protein AAF193_11065, partial [Bacteroidota bacterium]